MNRGNVQNEMREIYKHFDREELFTIIRDMLGEQEFTKTADNYINGPEPENVVISPKAIAPKVNHCTCGGEKLQIPHSSWCDLIRGD